ncbi:hypothetical protein L210DRAFT_3545515 [Boletus edulis BED1]|uniref:Uncharacterized protein n=1 Tax=Boletus edulis BED1 TaxID=1328754 RepID=A0AAD4BS17_BOLED|nr:hypothetical protein L210DRAFT_3545515 [Boletus edulis BED1]
MSRPSLFSFPFFPRPKACPLPHSLPPCVSSTRPHTTLSLPLPFRSSHRPPTNRARPLRQNTPRPHDQHPPTMTSRPLSKWQPLRIHPSTDPSGIRAPSCS